MAKKSSVEEEEDTLFEKLSKKYGNVFKKGSEIPLIERISTGIAGLDVLTGGGWPKGRLVEIAGKESMGKTAIMLQACKHEIAQGYKTVFEDLERTLAKDHLDNLEVTHNDLIEANRLAENLVVAYPNYGEEALDIALSAAAEGVRLIVIDSLPLMIPKTVADKIDDDSEYNAPAMAQAAMFNRLKGKLINGIELSQSCLVFINQVRDKQNSPMGGVQTPGGHTIKHAFSIEIMITHAVKDTSKDGIIKSHLKTAKNKTHTAYLTTEIPINKGVVQLGQSLVIEAVKVGLMQKAGSWMKFNETYANQLGVEKINVGQGEEKAGEFLDSNPELYDRIYKDVLTKNGIV